MRIELNSGGLSSGAAICDFQSDFNAMISKSKKVVSSFQKITSFANNMNGGVGSLQNAVNQIESRRAVEEEKVNALEQLHTKADNFIEYVRETDRKTGILVSRNKQEFYDLNSWAKPPPPPEEEKKNFFQSGWEWLCEKGEEVKEKINDFKDAVVDWGKSVADSVSKAWQGIKDFCNSGIGKILISVGVVAVLTTLTVCTGGVAAVIFGMGAIGAGAGLVTGTAKGVQEYNIKKSKGEDVSLLDSIADNMAEGTIGGAASGLADGIGLVFGPGARFVAGEILQVSGDALTNMWIKGQSGGEAWSNAAFTGTFSNVLDSTLFGITSGKLELPRNQILQYAPKEKMLEDLYKETLKEGLSTELRLSVPKTIASLLFGAADWKDIVTNYFTGSEVY